MLLERAGPWPKGGPIRPLDCTRCSVFTAGAQHATHANGPRRSLRLTRGHYVQCSLSQRSVADQRKHSSSVTIVTEKTRMCFP